MMLCYVISLPPPHIQVPNAPSTGASTGSDLNGGAVKDACEVLKRRLEKFMDDLVETADMAAYKEKEKEFILQWKNGNRSWNSKESWPTVIDILCISVACI